MIILFPIYPTIEIADKKYFAMINEFISDETGLSIRTVKNILSEKHSPSQKTIDKFIAFYIRFKIKISKNSIFSIRKVYKKSDWLLVLNENQELYKIYPCFSSILREVAILDEAVERRYKSKEKIISLINKSIINDVCNKDLKSLKEKMNYRESMVFFIETRIRILILLLACIDIDMESKNKEIIAAPYFKSNESTNKIFIEQYKKQLNIESNKELYAKYSKISGLDIDDAKRHILKISTGKSRISSDTLSNLYNLNGTNSIAELFIMSYIVSNVVFSINKIVDFAMSEGVVRDNFKTSMEAIFYKSRSIAKKWAALD